MSEDPFPGAYAAARSLVAGDLGRIDEHLERVLSSQEAYLTDAERTLYRRGKRLRPLLLVLSAHVAAQPAIEALPDKIIAAAASLELSHVGSLIHDDIVDRAPMRRGMPTISASRGYELALVIGDLQWVQATRTMAAHMSSADDIWLMREFLEAGEQTCRGQLDEMLGSGPGTGSELVRRYYRTIDRKTGRLVSFACEGGARLMDGLPATVGGLRRFGAWLGRAFQVMDDVLDVVRSGEAAGKEPLIDLRRGRLSLPVLYMLEELAADHPLQRMVTGAPLDETELELGVRLLRHGDAWIRALGDARAIVALARAELALLAPSPHRDALDALATHVVDQGLLDSKSAAAMA